MRRKVTVMTMVLAMALSLAACGGKDAGDVSGKITPVVSDEKEKEDATPTEAADATDETEGQEKKDENAVPEGKQTSLGRVQGGVYVNEYMGISCELDSGWEFYTAEELQDFPKNVEEMFAGTEAEEMMSNLQTITDMSAESEELLASMNIQYQKMSLQERLAMSGVSNSDIVNEMVTSQKDMLVATYAQAGINVQEMYKKTVTFCGEKRDVLYMACDVSGVAYYGIQVFDYSLGDYSVVLTVTSFVEDKTEELLKLFSKYE